MQTDSRLEEHQVDDLVIRLRQFAQWVREWDAFELGGTVPQQIDYQAEAALFDEAAAEIVQLRALAKEREWTGAMSALQHDCRNKIGASNGA